MKKIALLLVLPLSVACTHSAKRANEPINTSNSLELKDDRRDPNSLSLEGTLSMVPDEATVDISHVAPGGKVIAVYEETQVRSPERGVIGNLKIYDISENVVLFDKSVVHTSKPSKEIDLESASDKAKNDLFALADKRFKEFGMLRLDSNPLFTQKNVELIKRYDGYYTNEGSHRRDSIYWNDRTYQFEIGNPKSPVTMSKACRQINNPDNKLAINGKVVFEDSRQPSSDECPSTLGLHMIYSVRGHLVFLLKNLSSKVATHEQRSYMIPVWDMSKVNRTPAATPTEPAPVTESASSGGGGESAISEE